MTQHRIVLRPSMEPRPVTADCPCGEWSITYHTFAMWDAAVEQARQHVLGVTGRTYRQDDMGNGDIVVYDG